MAEVELPSYVGLPTFCKRDHLEDPAALAARAPDVAIIGAPLDEGVSHRPGARFGPRAIRAATYTEGDHSLQLGVEPWRTSMGSTPATPPSCRPGWSAATP